jgi:hypothetical protein
MPLDPTSAREHLNAFDFKTLFIEDLGWSKPTNRETVPFECQDAAFIRQEIAALSGVVVFEVTAADGSIPDADTCKAVHKQVSELFHENLLIFLDAERTQSLWYWAKREGAKLFPRRHSYFRGQPGDLFLSKISAMFVDIADMDAEGGVSVVQAAKRLQDALDVATTTKKFFKDFETEHAKFLTLIEGIGDERDRRWYASVLLNRLMFIYFLQRKGFLDGGNRNYLQDKLARYADDTGRYYSEFLKTLFFEGFAKPADKRTPEANALLGSIVYLNGGLFLEHQIEERWTAITIPDAAFHALFSLFSRYSWNLDDTPGGKDDEINPDVLGYIFEKYINQKAFGAYYTRTEITEYLCEQTIHRLILDKVNVVAVPGVSPARHFDTMADLLMRLDAPLCRELLAKDGILPRLSLLDPACGSGAFLVAAMKTLINIYSAVFGRAKFLNDRTLTAWIAEAEQGGRALGYTIKKRIITDNLFGVDIMEESTEIAKLRLFLALVSSAQTVEQLEPLPNIDFNILAGNSLVGLLRVTDEEFKQHSKTGSLFQKPYREILDEKNRLIAAYRDTSTYMEDLRDQRDTIDRTKHEAQATLNDILLNEFKTIKYEQATWDAEKNAGGKPVKRAVTLADVETLHPFHWGYEFDEVLNVRGGFDAIITNPPWEIFKPQAKEFFAEHSQLVTKNKMTIKEFEDKQAELLADPDIREAWLTYQSRFPYLSAYYRTAKQYENQISVVNGKKAGTDINLYKLFTEQCFNLLRPGGLCGIVIPSGIYTDLGTKQLREMLFDYSEITGLFCFENRREIFENVHRSFKFVVLTFEKGNHTPEFPAAFMRHDVAELERFPREGALHLPVEMIKRLSPDSASIMEFKNETDVQIAERMLQFPLLGDNMADKWNLALTREFDMTNDSKLFRTSPAPDNLPLYEGKMIWQFDCHYSEPRYFIDKADGRATLLGRTTDQGQKLGYQDYRIGFRSAGENTNMRNLIVAMLPPNVFCGNSVILSKQAGQSYHNSIFICAILNSFILDYAVRLKISRNMNMFYVYQLPVPRLIESDPAFAPIVNAAARLICTTPEFDALAQEVGLGSHANGATDPADRAKLRAELDGRIAHLYGLTEDEFAHILRTFPIVAQTVKDAALDAYRTLGPGPDAAELVSLIQRGESAESEFKSSARWDMVQNKKNKDMEQVIVKTVAAFLNSNGGTLLIGVADDGTPLGLAHDLQTLGDKKNLDGYELFLTDLLLNAYGRDVSAFLQITFGQVSGQDICQVRIKPAPKAIWIDGKDSTGQKTEQLYIRTGNSSRALTAREATDYVGNRWK